MAENVLTLIAAAPDQGRLILAAEESQRALVDLGAKLGTLDWLAPDGACDIFFDELAPDQADAAARAAIATLPAVGPLDVVAQPAGARRKGLLVADMESTVIENEMLDELGDVAGLGAEIAAITARAMNGEIDFASAVRERVGLLQGMPESVLAEAARRIRPMAGAATLVATMRRAGAYTALVSSGFRNFAKEVQTALGFDIAIANELVVADGRIAGVREPILGREAKLASLTLLAVQRGLPLSAALAVGDGANDIGMIEAAGMGIAFRAKPAVAAQARLKIDHADLTALLYAQGYRKEEFIDAL